MRVPFATLALLSVAGLTGCQSLSCTQPERALSAVVAGSGEAAGTGCADCDARQGYAAWGRQNPCGSGCDAGGGAPGLAGAGPDEGVVLAPIISAQGLRGDLGGGRLAGCAGSLCDGRCEGRCALALARLHQFRPVQAMVHHAHWNCANGYCGRPAGPETGSVMYPYYTLRGPRDFLMSNPPSIGP